MTFTSYFYASCNTNVHCEEGKGNQETCSIVGKPRHLTNSERSNTFEPHLKTNKLLKTGTRMHTFNEKNLLNYVDL
jgi:hypothetical protein